MGKAREANGQGSENPKHETQNKSRGSKNRGSYGADADSPSEFGRGSWFGSLCFEFRISNSLGDIRRFGTDLPNGGEGMSLKGKRLPRIAGTLTGPFDVVSM